MFHQPVQKSTRMCCLIGWVAILLTSGCALLGIEVITGSGVPLTEVREVAPFHSVSVSGALNAEIASGPECTVTVDGDDNLVPLVQTRSSDGRLSVSIEGPISVRPKTPLKITIACPDLDAISVSGASDVVADGIAADRFFVHASGASDVKASGVCGDLDVEVSGASDVNLVELEAARVDVGASGASSVKVFATESISGGASGASDVLYDGTDSVNVGTSGASDVSHL